MSSFRSEFQLKHFFFRDVANSQVHKLASWVPPGVLLVYRTLVTFYLLAATGVSVWHATYWLTYLTTWTWLLCVVYYTTMTTASWFYYCSGNTTNSTLNYDDAHQDHQSSDTSSFTTSYYRFNNADEVFDGADGDAAADTDIASVRKLPKHSIVVWVLFEMSLVVSMLVTVMFWGFVMQPEHHLTSSLRAYRAINEHGGHFFLLLIDFWFHRMPVRILHMVYPVGFALSYMFFNLIYTLVTKRPVYPIVDWVNRPGVAVGFVLVAIGLLVLGQVMFYGLHRLKLVCCVGRERRWRWRTFKGNGAYRRMEALL